MANYKNGIITKNKIYETCKELFYLQGYKNTSYKDICAKADVSATTITHFFQSKKNIAIEIYSDFLIDIKKQTRDYLLTANTDYNLRVGTVIERLIFTNLVFENIGYQRFYYDICVDGLLLETYVEKSDYFFKLHSDEYNIGLSDSEIKLLQITTTAISLGIERKWIEGFFTDLTKEDCFNYEIKLMFYLMRVPDELVDQIIEKAYSIYSKMNILTNGGFSIKLK